MLYEAANRPETDWPPFEDCIEEPQNRRHWIGLMTRPGDLGVIAELARAPVGAAWVRRMREDELRPLDDPAVPVLAIGVESGGARPLLLRSSAAPSSPAEPISSRFTTSSLTMTTASP
jgi:hypothetical protein